VPVTIVSGSEPLPEADASFAPRMEMHSVSREAVTATVAQMGGEVLDALPDGNAGAGFLGFRYVVRRTSLTERPVRRQWLEDLEATIAAIVDRPDMLPPVLSRRAGRTGQAELLVKRGFGRALRWFTWAQAEHDRSVVKALRETRTVLSEQQAELRSLRAQLAALRARAEPRGGRTVRASGEGEYL